MNSVCGGGGGGGLMTSSPFTVSQWRELEHQALIFKYILAGLPVPHDLVLPIKKSFESVSSGFFQYPTPGYCTLYGKKVDPEPGRCRRTDGKKWRCSKEAYGESKYCERHMHRGRNRSRKPVESTGTSSLGKRGGTGTFQNLPLHVLANNVQGTTTASVSNQQQHYNAESIPFAIPSKDYRYSQGLKPEAGKCSSFFSEASGSNKNLQTDLSQDNNKWLLMQSCVSSLSTSSRPSDSSTIQNSYPQNSFFNTEYESRESIKHDDQSARSFFDKWPKTRESWTDLEDDRLNATSFSTTQLSISTPMASTDFSATSSGSPHDG